ncbi:MAG: DNA (cytosine-5-)-methyltransferase [Deltaproteobacteria bacterium]|nr:DNA (cytosine-5-)-methyltransferase [Deltaproteobacteria bacterium]
MDKNPVPLIKKAVDVHGLETVADNMGKSPRTIRRWMAYETKMSVNDCRVMEQLYLDLYEASPKKADFTFIDLFAGIGGLRLGFEDIGGQCIFTSEWDAYSQKTYRANFNDNHELAGDINDIMGDIRKHIPVSPDVLLAGFPCQPFSIAGVSKKNALGRPHGFACKEQGNLFFHIASILAELRPPAFLLENVKNLERHDKGNTFRVIMDTLVNKLEYKVHYKVIDAKGFVPQHRERIFIVGFDGDTGFTWDDLNLPDPKALTLKDILQPATEVDSKYILSDHLWRYLQDYAAKHKAAGHGFGFGLTGENETTRPLTPRYFKDGSEILVYRGTGKNPRRLTPRECARLMGFRDDFKIPVSDLQAYKQFGNASVVPVIREIARTMNPHILEAAKKNSDNLAIFLMTDQPETCGICGARTNWIDYKNGQQLHTCPSCNYIYLLEECDE